MSDQDERPAQDKRCEHCWHPPREIKGLEGLHNPGCPTLDPANMADWKQGRAYGFRDNHIESWRYPYYKPAFILGWRVGKDEIDGLVEAAAEANYSY